MKDLDRAAQYLGQNLEVLRKKRDWSQVQLAKASGIPRTTITNIESGSANPSLSNLIKLAAALNVGLEELLSRPRAEYHLVKAVDVPVIERSRGTVEMHKLLPDQIKGIEMDRLEFAPGAHMRGRPHLTGTKEYLTVLKGELSLYFAGQSTHLKKGDVLAFPGDQAHAYRNPKTHPAQAISMVIPIPAHI